MDRLISFILNLDVHALVILNINEQYLVFGVKNNQFFRKILKQAFENLIFEFDRNLSVE